VSPARDFAAYRDKAVDSAASSLSQARTAILTAQLANADGLFAPNVSVQLAAAESGAITSRDVFASIQPPDAPSDRLRAVLLPLLTEVVDQIAMMRIAARRNDLRAITPLVGPLSEAADRLERFSEPYP
jgi:hypothetical protein